MQTDATLLANNTQHCWAQQCCDLLRPFAWNHNNVGTCCVQFETGQTFRPMQTDATLLTNNTQQCWELLALVASVCMGLNSLYQLLLVCSAMFCFHSGVHQNQTICHLMHINQNIGCRLDIPYFF